MAKVQAKKAAGSKKVVAKRPAVKPKPAAPARKAAKPVRAAAPKASSKKAVKPGKPAAKAASKPAKAGKVSAKPSKQAGKPSPKAARPAPAKGKPAKSAAKASSKAAVVAKTVAKNVARVAASAAVTPVMAKAGQAIAAKVAPVVAAAKRTRRARPRVQSNGVAVANWFVQDKPRPSSFIPAPARAEAPSLVAAPPASSDRLIRPEDLNHLAVRTVPVRVDVEQGGGRVFIGINPQEVTLRAGEGIEWDFRYLGGADVIVDELVIEFDKPSPFTVASFRSRKPGTARPHRQMSGAAAPAAAGKRIQYTIRAISAFKTELASTKPWMSVLA